MSWVHIDKEKCTECGICAIRCPRCFTVADEKVSVQADENCCIVCGHCVSLCPRRGDHPHADGCGQFRADGAVGPISAR